MRIDRICAFIRACGGLPTVLGGLILVPGAFMTLVIESSPIIKIYGYTYHKVWVIKLHKDHTEIHEGTEVRDRLVTLAYLFRKYTEDECPAEIHISRTLRKYIRDCRAYPE